MNFCLNKGDIFSGCKIISKCGEGAFGVTYYALNPIQQPVIIKVIPFSKSSERELKGLQNYMAVSGKHQNLLQIFHIGEFENGFYYIMEAADNCNSSGEYYPATLGNLFRREHEFSPEKAIQITRELLEGLKFMHNAGLIHRDIKPDNIIFVNNVPKLSDPGLVVKLGQTTSCAGTIGFIPPEVLNEESDMDHNADIYALGKVFYCMVTGLKPKQYPQLPMDMRVEVCRQIYPALSRMCNRNPDKRFKNADEFLAGLPVELEKPTYFETMRENLRNWYILNREKARLLLAAVATFFLLIIIAGAVLLTVYISRARKNAMYNNKVQRYLKINTDRKELLALQLQQFFPDAYDDFQKMSKKLNRIYPKNPEKSASITERLHILLGNCAKRGMPAFPDKKDDLSTNLTVLGQAYGFISSPLAMYLKPSELKSFKQKLADFEKGSYRNYSGPRCSSEYLNFNNPEMVMVFVPPGAVRLPHNKKIYKIPYHFWICKNEIISDDFTLKLGIAPQKNPRKGVPVERMTWNDLLFYCYLQTLKFKELNALPPGYIIRPLNEAEWQFAATNAWLGKDTDAPQKRIVAKETANSSHPSGYKNPNRLGIFDIYGNVSEIVQPVEPTKMQLSNVIRGGSFLNKLDKCETLRNEFLSYQNIPFDIGSRAALAPGDMDYFDRHFFLGGKTQCSVNGKIYELIGTNIGFFRWHTAEHLANLLGGRLAEFKTPQELKEVRKKMPLAGQWPTVVGGIKKRDKWVWLSDNTPVSFGNIRKSSPGKRGGHLALQGGTWVEKHHESMSIFICQWDADKFADRNKNLVKRAGHHLLKRFSYQGREFLLLSFPMSNYSAVRCAELLGGRLASLDSPELLALAKKELKAFENHRIRIGAYAKRDKWYWMSGRELTEKVLYSAKISRYKTETRNNNLAILYGGKIYDSASASAFLLELASPNLR